MVGSITLSGQLHAQEAETPVPPPNLPPPPPPPAVRPPPPAPPPRVLVRFRPSPQALTLLHLSSAVPVVYVHGWYYRQALEPVFSPVCNGPCTRRLLPGEYRFAVARPGRPPIAAEAPVFIDRPVELRAHYDDRRGLRTAGAVIAITGPIAGIVMMAAGTHSGHSCDYYGYCYRTGNDNGALMAGGMVSIIGGLIVGSVLMAQGDSARLDVVPMTATPVLGRESAHMAYGLDPVPQGAAIRWRF